MLGLGGFHALVGKAKPPRQGTWAEAIGNTNPVGGLGALRRAGLRLTLPGLVPTALLGRRIFSLNLLLLLDSRLRVCAPPTPERAGRHSIAYVAAAFVSWLPLRCSGLHSRSEHCCTAGLFPRRR
jgi:hypothetical protein